MKSKIIINVFIVYFIILLIVLLSQIKAKDIVANEPISTDITVEDKIKNSTILFVDSPFYIMNEKQSIIDNDLTITPIVYDGKVYIPVRFIANAYNANINFSKSTKELTVRLNNKAIIFYNNENKIKIIDNVSEEIQEIEATPLFVNDRIYIPLRTFAQAFEKEVFYYDNLIVISNINDIFDPMEEIDLIDNLSNQVKNLPTLNSKDKLIEILNNKNFVIEENVENVNSKDNIEESIDTENNIKEDINIENNIEESINTENTTIDDNTTQEINLSLFFVKQIDNIDFYFIENTLYGYKNNELSYEINLTNEDNKEYELNEINIFDKNLVLVYSEKILLNEEPYFYISIYNDEGNRTEKINGNFEKISFSKKIISIVSTQEVKDYSETSDYTTPTLKFETGQKTSYNDIIYFPELNGNFYTTITNISFTDENYLLKKVFFGVGENIYYNNNYLYFITEKDDYSFIHAFKINDTDLEYIKRIYVKGKINNLYFDNENNIIKISCEYENEEINFILDYNLNNLS